MNTLAETLINRRSIRRYEREAIVDEDIDLIHEAIRNTPTSYNGQQFSVIDITDQDIKLQLEALTGQKQIKTCSHFMMFCADYHKIAVLAERKGLQMPDFQSTVDGVLVGVIDASLAMMSAVAAATSLGLGTCCIGYARTAAPAAIARLLNLPKGVFAVCGLALGVPREMPDLKPKQPRQLVIHSNAYQADDERLLPLLEAYDDEISTYNTTREGTKTDNDWCDHILSYYREAMNYRMLDALRGQGYDVTH